MSKGFADYLCVMAREIDREFEREKNGVEVPLFKDAYEKWLATPESKVGVSAQINYMRWLHKADKEICESEYDFWELLQKAWRVSDFQKAKELCDGYEKKLIAVKEWAAKEDIGLSAKEIGNWIASFRKYRIFLEKCIKEAEEDKQKQAAMIESARANADRLFLSESFLDWASSEGNVKYNVAQDYVSRIKRVNRELFCKTGHDMLHEYLPGYVKTGNTAKIDEMFNVMDKKLTERIDNYNETEMSREAFQNGRAALRKYAEFLKSIITTKSK